MALKHYNFSLQESNKLLRPCWVAGQYKWATTQSAKHLALDEIRFANVVNCCKQIKDIIEHNQNRDDANELCKRSVAFSGIARLTIGVSFIYNHQVSSLLNDTKRLLDQIKGTNFAFDDVVAASSSTRASSIYVRRKRKQVISRTVCVSKRARIASPQLLDEDHMDYYRNMLNESQFWSDQNQLVNIKQAIFTTEQYISITEKLTVAEFDVAEVVGNDGFGELGQMDEEALQQFLPVRNSLKRKSPEANESSELSVKKPTLTNISINSQNQHNLQELHLFDEIVDNAAPTAEVSTIYPTNFNSLKLNRRNSRKLKLKIDKYIKLSRGEILKHRMKYYEDLDNANTVDKKPKTVKQCFTLLNSFKQSVLFPDVLKERVQLSSEQCESDCEYTLRAILDVDYNDALASNILNAVQLQQLENSSQPPILTLDEPQDNLLLALELQPFSNNITNNNPVEHIKCAERNDFDSYSIMMDLLAIWRDNPDLKSIDAVKFIKSFPDRFKAALAFSHLLSLSRDGFIQISKKLGTLEMDAIALGPESIKLIENVSANNRI
ncbi:uncharacterized protein LOC117564916 [Drosophila albomicans]|uniref:Uncharacterized protein LOC117564916 n=1 Tax=Drosophila albomicans TaxID=7291 RepID=A0A6P8WP35_DROAB|nr:uncharacterized protein LOC117564916 [Drosophila albomicans]